MEVGGFFFDFEAVRTRCSAQVRTAPFVVRAPSPREFEDWLRALRWCLARLRRGSVEEEPSSEGVSRDFYLSGGSDAGITPETHTASTTSQKPAANYKDELEEAL